MTTKYLRSVLAAAGAAALLASLPTTSHAQTITQAGTGSQGGYFWSFWRSGNGSASLNLLSGGHFTTSWNNIGDVTMGKGWNPGGPRIVNYNCGTYWNTGGGTAGMYGWMQNPQTEWYVNEFWGAQRPNTGTYLGTFWSDGAPYDMYKTQLYGSSPNGNEYFWQVYSSRQQQNTLGQNHTINTGNHFYAWSHAGVPLGSTMQMMFFDTEGWGGSGGADVTIW